MVNPVIENSLDILFRLSVLVVLFLYFSALLNKKLKHTTKIKFIKFLGVFILIGSISFVSKMMIYDHNLNYIVKTFVSEEIKEELLDIEEVSYNMHTFEGIIYPYAYYVTTKENKFLIFLENNKDVIKVEKAVNVSPELIYDR